MKLSKISKKVAPKNRIWEIDALRGLMILGLLGFHLYFTVDAFCINGYYHIDSYAYVNATDPLHFWFDWGEDGVIYRAFLTDKICHYWMKAGVDGFFVISGICCLFSRNNLHRGLKMLAGAYFISGFTKLLAIWTGDPSQFIRFGALHCYAYCHLIYYFLLEKRSDRMILVVAALSLAGGYYLRYSPRWVDFPWLYPFGIKEIGTTAGEYWPIFPMLGWLLLGVVLGRRIYGDKRSLLPTCPAQKWLLPFRWCGQYSGFLYVGHIVLYPALFCGIGWLFQLY